MSEQNGKRTVNRLERKEVLRLGHWLQSQIEALKEDATPFVLVAERATKELGFIIGQDTVRHMLRDLDMHKVEELQDVRRDVVMEAHVAALKK